MYFRKICLLLCITFIFYSPSIYAISYDDDTLDIFAKITPRFVLLSDLKSKLQKDITLCILHDPVEQMAANSFANKIAQSYPKGIKDYTLKTIVSSYPTLDKCSDAQLLFLFNTDEATLMRTLQFAQKKRMLTVAYDAALLTFGVDFSLFLGRNITPYINMKSIFIKDIQLDNLLFRISKIYTAGEK
ncbi:MAG: hypothetical protein PHU40_08825 [Sulfurimonas sp.]|nr:hypothetical protein [Sulfurimonas sp.]